MRRADRHGAGAHAAHHDDEKELTERREDRKQDDPANPPGQAGEQRTPRSPAVTNGERFRAEQGSGDSAAIESRGLSSPALPIRTKAAEAVGSRAA